jgi:NADPH2:quinone reductase
MGVSMDAVVMHGTGGPEVLTLERVPLPVVEPGQVLVRIEAIGVSEGETRLRAGTIPVPWTLPVIVGAEVAGVVEQLGAGVDPAWGGARVVGVTGGRGSYAEFVAVDATNVARVPAGLSMVDAVASAASGAMALGLVHRAQLRAGETVLVEGGSGKVGGYLVRLARELGAGRVVATAGAPAGRSRAAELGADVTLDHTDPEWPDGIGAALEGGTVDVAFEMVGGEVAGRVLGSLTPSVGRMLAFGMRSGRPPVLDAATVLGRGLQVVGFGGAGWFTQVLGVHLPEFLERAAQDRSYLQRVDAVLPLREAADAHRRIESGTTTGRIVLIPNG